MDLGLTDGLQLNSILELEATVNTQSTAGLIFDFYSESDFKFVAIKADTGQAAIGHYTAKRGWQYDAVVDRNIKSGRDYQLTVSLKGTTVSVSLDGQVVLGHVFNAVVVDGSFGLMADTEGSFDDVTVKTDDPAFRDDGDSIFASGTPCACQAPMGHLQKQVYLFEI